MSDFTTWRSLVDGEEIGVIPDSGGTHQWNADEGSESTLADAIGNLTGTRSTPEWRSDAGVGGHYLHFGGEDAVTLENGGRSELSHWINDGVGTYVCWINRDETGTRHMLVGGNRESGKKELSISIEDDDSISADMHTSNGKPIDVSGGSVLDDGWVCIAVTADGEDCFIYHTDENHHLDQKSSASIETDDLESGDLDDDVQFGERTSDSDGLVGGFDVPWFDDVGRSETDLQSFVDDSKQFFD